MISHSDICVNWGSGATFRMMDPLDQNIAAIVLNIYVYMIVHIFSMFLPLMRLQLSAIKRSLLYKVDTI